jgi:sigma-B regulation protein RsbU (phosphoserine phosphatase)
MQQDRAGALGGTSSVAGHLMQSPPTVSSSSSNLDILELFSANPSQGNIPVIDQQRPIGIINRNTFMSTLARPFHREIFGRKSCTAFMNAAPLIVDFQTPLTELSYQVLSAGENVLADGFLITQEDSYVGMGLGVSLMQALADQQAEKHRHMMESIHYASVIQQSFLQSSRRDMQAALSDYFMHWDPRDVVGGDYYYFVRHPKGFFVAVIDCTGHGVPGAFMTLIMASALKQVLSSHDLQQPAALLSAINHLVKESLGQLSEVNTPLSDPLELRSDDGMDCAFCWFDQHSRTLSYAGAKTPIYLIAPGQEDVTLIDGNKKGVGYTATPLDYQWDSQQITIEPGTRLYICTDGLVDQIGGHKRICYGKKRFREHLLKYSQLPMAQQRERLLEHFNHWQAENSRRDDVTLFGATLS